MPTTSTLGISKPLDTDPVSDAALQLRTTVDDIDAMLAGRAAAWNQAAVAVAAGATVGMGNCAIPASDKPQTLHIAVLNTNSAAAANVVALVPGYENPRVVNITTAFRWGNGASASQQMHYYALPIIPGTSITAMSFNILPVAALAAARVLTWID